MSRPSAEIAADIFLNPGMFVMIGILGYMLFTVTRAATAGGKDRAAVLSQHSQVIPVTATFAGVRGLPSQIAIASNNARPLFAVGPEGIEYRVIRKSKRSFADIERIDVRKSWRTVNIEFLFRGEMLILIVNAGTDPVARTILQSIPDSVPMTPQAAIVRA